VLDDLLRQLDELLVLRHEVGLAVELQQRVAGVGHQPVGGGTPGALADVLGSLHAQQFDGLVKVAARLGQGVLAVQHAGAGQLPELLDVRGGDLGHVSLSLSTVCGVCAVCGVGQVVWSIALRWGPAPVAGSPARGAQAAGCSSPAAGAAAALSAGADAVSAPDWSPTSNSRSHSGSGSSAATTPGSGFSSPPRREPARAISPSATALAMIFVSNSAERIA